MKTFHCDRCRQLVFFENVRCVHCGHALAYLPDRQEMGALRASGDGRWRYEVDGERPQAYRLCLNYSQENVCNWAIPANAPGLYCLSCRLTRVIPDLSHPGHREAWYRLEFAKRRLVYSLVRLGLPLSASGQARGLVFEFRADLDPPGSGPVMTGHVHGLITIDLAEADDAERERRRRHMHEPYRTALGHFRHEVGHYYWERLVQGSDLIGAFRGRFGDER
ncbi:MAG TPA: putative zinc-binding metallopeptidase, partial [Pirellulales bacterium]|nr:putative zinc-binding metallopeptidase [Pirellulales bacterium]